MSDSERKRAKRLYRPGVEALEALRLLAGAVSLPASFPVEVEAAALPIGSDATSPDGDAWDAALFRTRVSDFIGTRPFEIATDPKSIASGIAQLDRYLSRAWYRAGIAVQQHDDCTQAVYTTLLSNLGRTRFDTLTSEIGRSGIKEVLSRETDDGPDFFRAIDTVKKRAQRERVFQSIDAFDIADAPQDRAGATDWRGTLQDAIDQTLNPREAALMQATLQGETPAEIAQKWGVAPKTVSNEKSRAIQKLRDVLVADLID